MCGDIINDRLRQSPHPKNQPHVATLCRITLRISPEPQFYQLIHKFISETSALKDVWGMVFPSWGWGLYLSNIFKEWIGSTLRRARFSFIFILNIYFNLNLPPVTLRRALMEYVNLGSLKCCQCKVEDCWLWVNETSEPINMICSASTWNRGVHSS